MCINFINSSGIMHIQQVIIRHFNEEMYSFQNLVIKLLYAIHDLEDCCGQLVCLAIA